MRPITRMFIALYMIGGVFRLISGETVVHHHHFHDHDHHDHHHHGHDHYHHGDDHHHHGDDHHHHGHDHHHHGDDHHHHGDDHHHHGHDYHHHDHDYHHHDHVQVSQIATTPKPTTDHILNIKDDERCKCELEASVVDKATETNNYTITCSCKIGITSCPCKPNPCKNGGKCTEVDKEAKCSCVEGFKGTQCETKDPCKPNPCKNGGKCSEEGKKAKCSCPEGFIGSNCEEKAQSEPTKEVKADVAFLFETSSNVGEGLLEKMKEFATNVMRTIQSGPEENALWAVLSFAAKAKPHAWLKQCRELKKCMQGVGKVKYTGGDPNLGAAIKYIKKFAFKVRFGRRVGTKKAILVLGGGDTVNKEETTKRLAEAKAQNMMLLYIAFGGNADKTWLESNFPGENHLIFKAENLQENINWIKRIFT